MWKNVIPHNRRDKKLPGVGTAKERKRREKGTCLFNFLRYVFVVVRSIVFRTQLAHGRSFSDVDMTH